MSSKEIEDNVRELSIQRSGRVPKALRNKGPEEIGDVHCQRGRQARQKATCNQKQQLDTGYASRSIPLPTEVH